MYLEVNVKFFGELEKKKGVRKINRGEERIYYICFEEEGGELKKMFKSFLRGVWRRKRLVMCIINRVCVGGKKEEEEWICIYKKKLWVCGCV